MHVVPDLTLRALRARGVGPPPGYARILRAACAASPPPFGLAWYGDKYRRLARDVDWLADSLVGNASKEAEGARQLWELAGMTGDPEIAERIRQHAIDESRHARMYVAMLEIVFPEAALPALRPFLRALSPGYRRSDHPPAASPVPPHHVLDALIQMNLGEIRTRINMLLMSPVVTACCATERRGRLERLLGSLMSDETRHIEYTARLIEEGMRGGEAAFVEHTMARRLEQFNEITLAEVEAATFSGT